MDENAGRTGERQDIDFPAMYAVSYTVYSIFVAHTVYMIDFREV